MRTRQTSLRKDCDRFGRQKEMGPTTPDAAGSTSAPLTTEHSYPILPASSLGSENEIVSSSTWHGSLVSLDGSSAGQRINALDDTTSCTYSPSTPSKCPDYDKELAHILTTMIEGSAGEELAEAFREGSKFPPITRQSLSELDIQNIIHNVKLRHDVNFDRDLSFRPNLDGARGQEKTKSTERYWKALVAELELYARLFQGTPISRNHDTAHYEALKSHAKRRIPVMFETIKEVLKSLVPDRDLSRVEEHLDVPMLMQEIERGVCDFARLATWLAQLLKEHCAPMRDLWVDQMVDCVRSGVAKHDSKAIVEGLCRLLGVLETMKLDVANHQIRNLKPLLVEDTINFEKHYHLERLVNRRSRVNIDVAEAWFRRASWKFMEHQQIELQVTPILQFEIFTRAVLAQLFNHDGRHDFPETFHLDQDRLRTLKAEIEDLVYLEVCSDVFAASLRQLHYERSVSPILRQQVRSSLVAIMGDAMGYGASQWVANSEALSLEILRQAAVTSGQAPTFDHATLSAANENLLFAFYNSSNTHNSQMEMALLQKVVASTQRHAKSTFMDLFNSLAPVSNTTSPPPTQIMHLGSSNTSLPCNISNPETAKWQDVANRITHIIILHWRTWKDIAYVPQETSPPADRSVTSPSQSSLARPSPSQTAEQDTAVLACMHTGDAPDTGSDTHVAHRMSSQ